MGIYCSSSIINIVSCFWSPSWYPLVAESKSAMKKSNYEKLKYILHSCKQEGNKSSGRAITGEVTTPPLGCLSTSHWARLTSALPTPLPSHHQELLAMVPAHSAAVSTFPIPGNRLCSLYTLQLNILDWNTRLACSMGSVGYMHILEEFTMK